VHRIIGEMPPHLTYVEGFLGHGAVMRAKRPAAVNIGIDADETVCGKWRSTPVIDVEAGQQMALGHGRFLRLAESAAFKSILARPDTLAYFDPPPTSDRSARGPSTRSKWKRPRLTRSCSRTSARSVAW